MPRWSPAALLRSGIRLRWKNRSWYERMQACALTAIETEGRKVKMPYAVTSDNVRLYFEEAGQGTPIIFLHEFAADHTNWEPQMRYFSRGHRCIAYSARGYTPSDVPPSAEVYTYG